MLAVKIQLRVIVCRPQKNTPTPPVFTVHMYIYTRDDSTAHRTPLRKRDIKSNQIKLKREKATKKTLALIFSVCLQGHSLYIHVNVLDVMNRNLEKPKSGKTK